MFACKTWSDDEMAARQSGQLTLLPALAIMSISAMASINTLDDLADTLGTDLDQDGLIREIRQGELDRLETILSHIAITYRLAIARSHNAKGC